MRAGPFLSCWLIRITAAGVVAVGIAHSSPAGPKIAPSVQQQLASTNDAEFLVVLAEQADLHQAAGARTKAEKRQQVRDLLWRTAHATQQPIVQWLRERGVEHQPFYIVNAIWVKADLATAQALAERADVAGLQANAEITNSFGSNPAPAETADTPAQTNAIPQGISYTGAPTVWNLGYTGQGIVVANIDTGVRWDHAALQNKYAGWNGATATHDYHWHDSVDSTTGACVPNSPVPCDGNGHGTHTMGTMVGDDGGNNQIGMAPGAKWIACRCLTASGGGTIAYILECLEFLLAPYPVAGTPEQGDVEKAPDVVLMALAFQGSEPAGLHAAVAALRAAGIMPVTLAGDGGGFGTSISNYAPARYDEAYTVAALNNGSDTRASFSSTGGIGKPDLSAPGTLVRSSIATTTTAYDNYSSTGMAAAHAAGAVALLWSANPDLRNEVDRTEQMLNFSAFPIGDPIPNHQYGYGRLNVKKAAAGALLQRERLGIRRNGADIAVSLRVVVGETYRLEYQIPSLSTSPWVDVPDAGDVTAFATGPAVLSDPGGVNLGSAYYRVSLLPSSPPQ